MVNILTNDCVDILKSKVGAEFSLNGFKVSRFDKFLGFQASYASLTVRATVSGEEKEFKFFVKIQNENPEINEVYWKHTRQFYKERIFLTTVVKELEKFVDQKVTATCHLSKAEEFLVMDDLTALGFETSRTALLDYVHVEKAVLAFANLHAASILCEERTGSSVKDKFNNIDFEAIFFQREGLDDCLLSSLEKSLKAVTVKYLSDWSDDKRDWFFDTIREVILIAFTNPLRFKSVICQGDPWGNNILYKYNAEGEPETAILVDFAGLRFGPPALDLMQFIYVGITDALRDKYKQQIIDLYYKSLTEILTKSGVNARRVFPKTLFTESCEYYERFAVAVNVYYSFILHIPEMYITKMIDSFHNYIGLMVRGDATLVLKACETHENYRKFIVSVLEETYIYFKQNGKAPSIQLL